MSLPTNQDTPLTPNIVRMPAIFIDCDGTLCEEQEYLSSPDQLKLIPNASDAIRFLNKHHILVILITNQSGIARNYFDEATLGRIHTHLNEMLAEQGAHLDAIYYCPHHPKGFPPYNIICNCRKPRTGLVEQACQDLPIDLRHSAFVGDKLSDTRTGMNLGIPSILVRTGYGIEQAQQGTIDKDYTHICDSLADATEYLSETLFKDNIDETSKR